MFDRSGAGGSERVLAAQAIPEALWREALESLPFLAIYTDDEIARLREKVVLFLDAKSIVGARGHASRRCSASSSRCRRACWC